MSFEEMSDVKGMNDDAKFDAHLKFGDKKQERIGSSQRVSATDEVADIAFISRKPT